jgi:bacterioferritin
MAGHPVLREATSYCESTSDYVSSELFEEILGREEERINWLETPLDLIGKIGISNYMQSQMSSG